jgi:hypothetical protein
LQRAQQNLNEKILSYSSAQPWAILLSAFQAGLCTQETKFMKSRVVLVHRRRQIADMYLKGRTQMEIAGQLAVSQMTVSRDLAIVEAEWRKESIIEFERSRLRELQKLELVEREAWDAWQRSQNPASAATITDGKTGQHSRKSLKHQYGDPRFLDQVNKCITQRCILLGLQPAAPLEGNGDDSISLEERRERIIRLFNELGDRLRAGQPGERPGNDEPGGVRAGDEPGDVAGGAAPDVPRPDAAGSA